MKIAFYAPLKSPDHPVPSGDRQMAKLLMAALVHAGHDVRLASTLRSYLRDPSEDVFRPILSQSQNERSRIVADWKSRGAANLWFTYHLYYKAPDLIGPSITRLFSIPYVTCEASYSPRRDRDEWSARQALVKDCLGQSALNIYFTERDRLGLSSIVDEVRLAELKPFTDPPADSPSPGRDTSGPVYLVTVAMMRGGDKFESFRLLASSLALLSDVPWHLTVIGDGPLRGEVRQLFGAVPINRVTWAGELPPSDIPARLSAADIFVWPGCGEAYGMAYLEAQAAGLPVVALDTDGVPSVVRNGETGTLTANGDVQSFAAAIRRWIVDPSERQRFATKARHFVRTERSLKQAAARLDALLTNVIHGRAARSR
jgi:glycosyltransferase involved in cell wall biosynthesis